MRKMLVVLTAMVLAAAVSRAESIRTTFTKENRMPDQMHFEVGAFFDVASLKGADTTEYAETPYVRFGIFNNLAVYAMVPIKQTSADLGSDEAGLGDIVLGAELVAYQDVFDYPYILPHAAVSFPSGDEDKGLGTGKTSGTLGVCIGTTVNNIFHYAVDLTYTFNTKARNEPIGEAESSFGAAALSFMWDLNKQFSLRAEAKVTTEKGTESDSDRIPPIYFIGGMNYQPTDSLMFSVYAGGAYSALEEALGGLKVAYSF